MRRHLVLHLPRFATDCLKRADTELGALSVPLVLYAHQQNAMRVAALDARAEQAGLFAGQSLSDARALCPKLVAREIDFDLIATIFSNFADWHTNASPIVSVLTDRAEFGDLALDIAGVAHLFGGEAEMLKLLTGRLEKLGYAVQGAIAPTIGAAWALAHFAPGQVIGADAELYSVLSSLPVGALRISPEQVHGLKQMGLKTIGQLYGRDRKALQARFGAGLLKRLDQALGLINERLTPRLVVPERMVSRKFAEPIGLLDDVEMTARDLAEQLCAQLQQEGMGAQSFVLTLYRVDHKLMQMQVNAARATRDAKHVARLFANRIDKLAGEYDAGFGIEMIRLGAETLQELEVIQTGVFETDDGAADLGRLYDRMASRLGSGAVMRQGFVESHIPERAVVLKPALLMPEEQAVPERDFERPLRLLPHPEEISVIADVPDGPPVRMQWRRLDYKLVRASGPERIGVEWWQPGEGAFTRDYYIGEDETGHRFWLYREGLYTTETGRPRWFLHGMFG